MDQGGAARLSVGGSGLSATAGGTGWIRGGAARLSVGGSGLSATAGGTVNLGTDPLKSNL